MRVGGGEWWLFSWFFLTQWNNCTLVHLPRPFCLSSFDWFSLCMTADKVYLWSCFYTGIFYYSHRLSQPSSVESRRNDNSIFEELSVQGTDMIAEVDFGADITGEPLGVVGYLGSPIAIAGMFIALYLSWLCGLADLLHIPYHTVVELAIFLRTAKQKLHIIICPVHRYVSGTCRDFNFFIFFLLWQCEVS